MNITPKDFLVLFFLLTSWNTCLVLTHVSFDKKAGYHQIGLEQGA